MIRFSAALVAVAIGVLIGGIATSRLLLVYIAIVVSAVALVALAIGVVLKREELFGEGQGLVPAGAGASPVLSARAGESAGESRDKVQASAHVAPPPPFQGAAGGYAAAFGGAATAASSPAGADPAAARTAAAGQGRSADPVPPWETQAPRGPWTSSTPDWMNSGPDQRAASTAGGAGGRAPSAWQDTTPAGTPGERADGWGVPSADPRAAAKAPRSWAAPSPPPAPPAPSDAPAVKPGAGSGAGSGSTTPSWFDRLGSQAAPTVASSTIPGAATAPGGTASGGTASGGTASGDTGAVDEDDDWPTRYSWLDDDTDESGEAGETVATPVADAQPEGKSPVPAADTDADTDTDAGPQDVATGTPSNATRPSATETADAATPAAGTPGTAGAAEGDLKGAADAGEPDADIIAFPSPGASRGLSQASDPGPRDEVPVEAGEPGQEGAADAAVVSETGSEPPAAAEVDAAPEAALVAVVPGVPRYHRTDCVLIRFMPEGDVKKLSVEAAKDTGCTPCAACQPAG